MGPGILPVQIVAIICCNKRDGEFPSDLNQFGICPLLIGKPVFHYLKVEIPISEDLPIFPCDLLCLLLISIKHERRYFTIKAGAHTYKSLAIPGQYLLVHSGAIVKPFEISGGRQFHKIFVSLDILDEGNKMM